MLFLSYSRKDSAQVEELERELKYRGIRVWRDVNMLPLGDGVELGLRSAIEQVDGMLIWVTRNSLRSQAVMQGELKWAYEQQKKNPAFFVIPVFAGIAPGKADEAVFKATGLRLMNGIVRSKHDKNAFLRRVATAVLREMCRRLGRKKVSVLRLGVHSKGGFTRIDPTPTFDLDWTDLFVGEQTPKPGAWKEVATALEDVRGAIAEQIGRKNPLLVDGHFHISIAFLLGNCFKETAWAQLRVAQSEQVWSSTSAPAKTIALKTMPTDGALAASDLVLELSITNSVTEDVSKHIARTRLSYRARTEIVVTRKNQVTQRLNSSGEAVAVAQGVRRELEKLRRKANGAPIHVFAALPIGLAVLIGRLTNAMGPLQLYELDKATHKYGKAGIIQ